MSRDASRPGPLVVATAVGLTIGPGAGYLVVREPLLDGPTLDPVPLVGATGAFIAGAIGATFGATKAGRGRVEGR